MTPGAADDVPIFTIGHSDRSLDDFLGLLHENAVTRLVDVRRLPGSAKFPWFDQEALAVALADAGIDYAHAEGLTGRRRVSRDVPFAVNGWWQNRSFHNYADYALTAEFTQALGALEVQGNSERVAVMCAEAVWWRCHRRIIADHLLARGRRVQHIMGLAAVQEAVLPDAAVVGVDGRVTYPASD